MEKAIFSITCTTCHARIVVRSEAAIGAILECPRCESMVQIAPPAGWKPASAASEEASALNGGPPPLSRVAAGAQTLVLEPNGSLLDAILGHRWLATGVTAAATLLAVGLWMLVKSPAESPAVQTKPAARTVATSQERPATEAAPKVERRQAVPVTPDAKHPASANIADGPKPPLTAKLPAGKSTGAEPQHQADPPLTDAARSVEPKRAEPDPLPPVADEAAPKPAEVRRLLPPQVDVAARLEDALPGVELTDTSLATALDLLATMSTAPITLDPDAMWQLGVTPQDRISLRLDATTVGKAIGEAAMQRGLAVVVEAGQIRITSPAEYRESLRKIRYTVADLTGDDKAAVADLAALVRRVVAPESWEAAGGRGSIEADQGALVVVQTGDVHHEVLIFCEKLRNARQKPLRSREKAERVTLTTRTGQARELLDRPVTVNFHEPTPLARILAFLAATTGSTILVDRGALGAAETCDRVETSVTVQKQGLGKTLVELLAPLGLAYRVIGPNLVQVTTPQALDERLELEFYSVKAWLERGVAPERLAERLKNRIAPSTWSDVGGQADICFDAPSGYFIVLQAQPAQTAIQRLLTSPPGK